MINIDSLVKSIIKPLLIENLDEAKQLGTIYHFTGLKGIDGILSSDAFKGSEISVLPLNNIYDRDFQSFGKSGQAYLKKGIDKVYYLSTTRDKLLYIKNPKIKNSTVRIVLDGDKLSNKYKFDPFYYYSDEMIDEPAPKHDQDESEERIVLGTRTQIGPDYKDSAKKYIKEVHIILDKIYDNEDYLKVIAELVKKYPQIKCYYKEKPIELEDYINNVVPTIEPYRYDDDIFESVVTPNLTFDKALDSLVKYMADQGMNIQPLPALKIINNDVENANNILGKTAYYDPNDCSITLYTLNRHPKDILRSFSHEMIHRIQDNEGRLNNIATSDTNEDGDLPELEREAYLEGNMTLRNWEDSVKNV
jgi:hypothetical protein